MHSQNDSTDLTTLFGADGAPENDRLATRLYWADLESGEVLAIDLVCTDALARDLVADGFGLSFDAARTLVESGPVPDAAVTRACHGVEQERPVALIDIGGASKSDPARN